MNENYQSSLNRLIQELCPDGVEYGKLGDFATVLYGYPCDASKFNTDYEGVPVIRIRDVMPGITETYTTETIPEQYIIHKDDFLVGMDGNFNCGKWKSEDGFLCQRVCRIKSSDNNILLNEFLFHFLGPAFKKIEDKKLGGTVKHLSAKDVNDIQIPLPPMEVQRKIARILDSFAELTVELTTELTAELTARKTQYEYYRDRMLKFDDAHPLNAMLRKLCPDGVEYKKLGDIATVSRGGNLQKKDFTSSGIPCIHYGQIYVHYDLFTDKTISFINEETAKKQKFAEPNDIIMAVTSENIEDVCKCVAWLGKENVAVSGHTAVIHHQINPKYLVYYLHSNDFYKQKTKLAHGTKVIEVTPDKLVDIIVPVPPMEVQDQIVQFLDKISTLCNDLSDGIPAEIEARQQQYEYYRDKLLQFEKKN